MSDSTVSQAPPAWGGTYQFAITACIMAAALMQALDTTIANVALPYMQGSLSATPDQANWVLTSYIVASAIMTPATGILENRFGRRHLFIASVVGFVIASMLCGTARSLEQMVIFRLVQGVFGAPLIPLAQAVLLDLYPAERRGSAMAIFGLGVMLGPIIGPSLGGWLTEAYNWRWVFYVNLPVGIIAATGLVVFLREPPRQFRMPFDAFGFALLSIAIAALRLFLDRGQQLDWFASPEISLEVGVFVLAAYMFIVHVSTVEQAFIGVRMFADRNFLAGQLLIFAIGGILLATLALLTPFLESLLNYPVLEAGLVLAPRGAAATCRISSWTRKLDTSHQAIVRTGLIQGVGLGLVFVPLSAATFATLAPRFRTQGTALFNLMRNIGSSIGISITSTLFVRYSTMMHASIAESINPFRTALQPYAGVLALNTGQGRALLDLQVTQQAMAIGYEDNFHLMMYASIALIPLVLLLRPEAQPARPG